MYRLSTSFFILLFFTINTIPTALAHSVVDENTKKKLPSNNCIFPQQELPQDFDVYALSDFGGSPQGYQMRGDNSGHVATKIDAAINYPSKPIVLMVGAHEPTIWNFKWTEGTNIVGVLATGNHAQAVAGLPKETPVVISTRNNVAECGYFYSTEGLVYRTEDNLNFLNSLSQKVFGQSVEDEFPRSVLPKIIGISPNDNPEFINSQDIPIESFFDFDDPLIGLSGIKVLLERGLIRQTTEEDINAWIKGRKKNITSERKQSLIGGENYVVLDDFTYPKGLVGALAVNFFIPKDVREPSGDPGHSAIYDLDTGKCSGVECGYF